MLPLRSVNHGMNETIQHISSNNILSTILRHDAKTTSYKIALLRAINDVVLSFPNLTQFKQPVLIPLRVLAEFWVAYYWPFVEAGKPIWQGARNRRRTGIANDMAFRPELTQLREAWEKEIGITSLPSDGYVLIHEMRIPRKRTLFSDDTQNRYRHTIAAISRTIESQPIRYAGPGEWTVFDKPTNYRPFSSGRPVPGTLENEKCLRISVDIWELFCDLSLWIEALCIHEWSLFTESVDQSDTEPKGRGDVYRLLTSRPENRRPLTWERNQVDILLMEGHQFVCPWTQKRISAKTAYDIDHLVPVSIYPINEMWNLIPTDRYFNQHRKRDRLPSPERLTSARPILVQTYATYTMAKPIAKALFEDVELRFTGIYSQSTQFADELANATVTFIQQVANSRNIARF